MNKIKVVFRFKNQGKEPDFNFSPFTWYNTDEGLCFLAFVPFDIQTARVFVMHEFEKIGYPVDILSIEHEGLPVAV